MNFELLTMYVNDGSPKRRGSYQPKQNRTELRVTLVFCVLLREKKFAENLHLAKISKRTCLFWKTKTNKQLTLSLFVLTNTVIFSRTRAKLIITLRPPNYFQPGNHFRARCWEVVTAKEEASFSVSKKHKKLWLAGMLMFHRSKPVQLMLAVVFSA